MLRLGILGLGRAARQVLRAAARLDFVSITAAADIRLEAKTLLHDRPEIQFFATVEELAHYADVDVVWVATPSPLHCDHVITLASSGKHIICEKPIAVSLVDCDRMIEAAARAGVKLMLVSKKFDPPIDAMQKIIASGRIGRAISVNSVVFTDWMKRPRLPEEFDTQLGGGVVFRQGPHLVDILRYLMGSPAIDVRAEVGQFDPRFPTPGNYSAFITFAGGASATLSFNGYGYFDSSELTGGYGEVGRYVDPAALVPGQNFLSDTVNASEKFAYLNANPIASMNAEGLPHYGQTIVTCERGVIRQSPRGILVYSANGREEIEIAPRERCTGELLEMYDSLSTQRPVFPDGEWGRATLEVCIAIMISSSQKAPVKLRLQSQFS